MHDHAEHLLLRLKVDVAEVAKRRGLQAPGRASHRGWARQVANGGVDKGAHGWHAVQRPDRRRADGDEPDRENAPDPQHGLRERPGDVGPRAEADDGDALEVAHGDVLEQVLGDTPHVGPRHHDLVLSLEPAAAALASGVGRGHVAGSNLRVPLHALVLLRVLHLEELDERPCASGLDRGAHVRRGDARDEPVRRQPVGARHRVLLGREAHAVRGLLRQRPVRPQRVRDDNELPRLVLGHDRQGLPNQRQPVVAVGHDLLAVGGFVLGV
mmetsp:Transcript_10061/g.30092  ORF Transcript_10061/g.30092 Transcript_10061/m.30092 type:complete len:269 (+) Transcript_10061:140-946(+)